MIFSYFLVKFIFNLVVFGWIDLRNIAFLELALLPLGQSILFWLVTRRLGQRTVLIQPDAG